MAYESKENPEFNGGLQTIKRVANLIWSAHVARMETADIPRDEFNIIDSLYVEVSPYMSEEEISDYKKLYDKCLEGITTTKVRELFLFVRKLPIVQKLTMKHKDELEGMFDD